MHFAGLCSWPLMLPRRFLWELSCDRRRRSSRSLSIRRRYGRLVLWRVRVPVLLEQRSSPIQKTDANLENHHGRPLTNYKPLPIRIKWSRRLFRNIVKVRRQTPCSGKSPNSQWMDTRLSTTGYHDICISPGDETSCITDGMGSGGAGSGGSMVGPLTVSISQDWVL